MPRYVVHDRGNIDGRIGIGDTRLRYRIGQLDGFDRRRRTSSLYSPERILVDDMIVRMMMVRLL